MVPSVRLKRTRLCLLMGGGPDAFETAERIRVLVREGAEVTVVAALDALRWVGRTTLETLSGAPVLTEEALTPTLCFSALVVAPAGRDLLCRIRPEATDDPYRQLLERHAHRFVLVPDEDAGAEPAARVALERLEEEGAVLPAHASGAAVADAVVEILGAQSLRPPAASRPALPSRGGLEGARVVVTAGPTREHLDPVRFLSNPSTGKMGYALAEVAARRGAEVVLISGPTTLDPPAGVRCIRVVSAEEMASAVRAEDRCDVFIGAAAVADYRPAARADRKLKKGEGDLNLKLVRTEDIIAQLAQRARSRNPRPILVGFAAETHAVEENAREKLNKKGLDLVVGNRVGGGRSAFGADENEAVLVSPAGVERLPRMSKRQLAARILDEVAVLLAEPRESLSDTHAQDPG